MKSLRSKKALALIVSVLLVSLIAVFASIMMYLWVENYFATHATRINEQTELGQIDISNIALKPGTNDTIVLDVRNIGNVKVTLDAVYINGASTVVSGTGGILLGTARTVEAKASSAFESGTTYTIKAVCTDGSLSTRIWSPT